MKDAAALSHWTNVASKLHKFSMPITESGCWIWLGCCDGGGYGTVRIAGKMLKAHRVSWIFHRGMIPQGLHVLHQCDIPPCINPDHLFLGTPLENMRDRAIKGRNPNISGENNPNAKLTVADIIAIRSAKGSHAAVGQRFGVGKSMIGYIRSGKHWK